jgi:hypothetical protein
MVIPLTSARLPGQGSYVGSRVERISNARNLYGAMGSGRSPNPSPSQKELFG